jgi:hypothetical protein
MSLDYIRAPDSPNTFEPRQALLSGCDRTWDIVLFCPWTFI